MHGLGNMMPPPMVGRVVGSILMHVGKFELSFVRLLCSLKRCISEENAYIVADFLMGQRSFPNFSETPKHSTQTYAKGCLDNFFKRRRT